MQNLIKELETNRLDSVLAEAKDPVDKEISVQVALWKELNKKKLVLDKIAKAVTGQIKELETAFEAAIKDIDGNKSVVDNTILEYQQKKSNTTVAYKEVVNEALKMVNEQQRKLLEAFIKTVTKESETTNVLAVVDPDLEKFVIDLKNITGEDMLEKIETAARAGFDRIPKQVANAKKRDIKESVAANITTVVKNLVRKIKSMFSDFYKALTKSKKATDNFVKAVNAIKVAESVEQVVEVKNGDGETEFTSFTTWKSAAKKVDAAVWFDGDKDISQALSGPNPFVKGKTKGIGEWDGEKGVIFGDAHLGKKTPMSESEQLEEAKAVSAANTAKLEKLKAELRATSDEIDKIVLGGGQVGHNDPLIAKMNGTRKKLKELNAKLGIVRK